MQSRSGWFTVHRWLGILLGVWFALVGLSGAILVFEDPIDAWLNPRLL
ncbi:MAG: PepSY domain-containing protein, partial [Burkholderiaceae bacterium]|nr:PepSY domain-containing protein [Burkholderiaceae bacterium]